MKRILLSILGVLCIALLMVFLWDRVPKHFSVQNTYARATVALFASTKKTAKILVVPGHDNQSFGAGYKNMREADVTAELAGYLYEFLNNDPAFEVFSTRDFTTGDYLPTFEQYFANETSSINEFKNSLRNAMRAKLKSGEIASNVTIEHNAASSQTVFHLYGINKWANENLIDLALHIHFNDYGRKRLSQPGVYSGFSFYIPEYQYDHAKESAAAALPVFNALKTSTYESTLPFERGGFIESQELIAVGANNSRLNGSFLVEYGYIYEPQFTNRLLRPVALRELAYQTSRGLAEHYQSKKVKEYRFKTSFLPYDFKTPMSLANVSPASFALIGALIEEGLYPPDQKTFTDCPIGAMPANPCLKRSLSLFSEKYFNSGIPKDGLDPKTKDIASSTLAKLDELYGR